MADSDSDSGEVYAECLKLHHVGVGRYANDGCLQYRQSLNCAVCGCHRKFHRNDESEQLGVVDELAIVAVPLGQRPLRQTRTRFSPEQRDRMAEFAERLGWHMPRRSENNVQLEREIDNFCAEVGIAWEAFKRWMSNHQKAGLAASSSRHPPPPPPPSPPPGGLGGSSSVAHA